MVERLSAVVGAPVSVKATRAEGLGALGRAEGIACLAVVLMEPRVSPKNRSSRGARPRRTAVRRRAGPGRAGATDRGGRSRRAAGRGPGPRR